MRQIRFLCAVLAVSVLSLTGCADIKNLSEEQENEIAAVSYTHLDVYKRQVQ